MAPGKGRDKPLPRKSAASGGGDDGGVSRASSSWVATSNASGGAHPSAPRTAPRGAAGHVPLSTRVHANGLDDRTSRGAAELAVVGGARADAEEKQRRRADAASDADGGGRLGRLARFLRIRRPDGAPHPADGGRGSTGSSAAAAEVRLRPQPMPLEPQRVAPAGMSFGAPGAGVREIVRYVEVKSLAQDSDDDSDGERRRRWQAAAQQRWSATGEEGGRSHSVDRERADGRGARRPRSTSRSRDIIALYTSCHVAAAAAATATAASRSRAPSAERSAAAASIDSASTSSSRWETPNNGNGGGGGFYRDGRRYSTARVSVRSSRSATPDARGRSSSASRAATEVDVISINGTRVLAPGYFSKPRRALSSHDVAAENLRVWMQGALERQRSASQLLAALAGDGERSVDGRDREMAVLETDKNAETRVEALLATSDSTNCASVPMLVVAGHSRDPMDWISQDEVDVDAGAVVIGLYKQKEWLRVRTEDGREGFIPYAFTRPLRSGPPQRDGGAGREGAGGLRSGGGDGGNGVATVVGDRYVNRRHNSAGEVAPLAADPTARARRAMSVQPEALPNRLVTSNARDRDTAVRDLVMAEIEGNVAELAGSDATRGGDSLTSDFLHRQAAPQAGGACKFFQRSRLAQGLGAQQQQRRHDSDDASSVLSSDDSVFRSPTPRGAPMSLKMARFAESQGAQSPSIAGGGGCGDVVHSDSGISEPGSVRSDYGIGRRWTPRDAYSSAWPAVIADGGRDAAYPRAASSASLSSGRNGVAPERGDRTRQATAAGREGVRIGHSAGGAYAQPFFAGEGLVAAGRPDCWGDAGEALERKPPASASFARTPAAPQPATALGLRPDIPKNSAGPLVTVAYDYRAANEDDVSVWIGETVRVLNADDVEWVWVRKCDGCEGFVPRQYVQIENSRWACHKPYVTAV